MIHQLRIYEIFERNKAAFHARFRDHAMRIMARHGFHLVAMWEAERAGNPEFVYLLDWPDIAAQKAGWTSFLADPEWIEIKRVTSIEHGDLVGTIEDRIMTAVGYSPTPPG
jgi:hypothetical protein